MLGVCSPMVVGLLVVAGMAGVAEAQAPQRDRDPRARGEMGRGGKDRQMGNRAMRGLLRGITLTDAEKAEMRDSDPRAREILERADRRTHPRVRLRSVRLARSFVVVLGGVKTQDVLSLAGARPVVG